MHGILFFAIRDYITENDNSFSEWDLPAYTSLCGSNFSQCLKKERPGILVSERLVAVKSICAKQVLAAIARGLRGSRGIVVCPPGYARPLPLRDTIVYRTSGKPIPLILDF